MVIELDQVLVRQIKGLEMTFKDEQQPDLLVRIPNRNKDVDYETEIVTSEFTSLCPLNPAQPDYATIVVRYAPRDWMVELKSLKFYLVSFRQVLAFHEEVPASILKDLLALLSPHSLTVDGQFTTRGGLNTTVRAAYYAEVEE